MGVRSPVHIIALGEVLGALAFVRRRARLMKYPRNLKESLSDHWQPSVRYDFKLPGKFKGINSIVVKRSGHSDAIDDSCSVCTMSCESM